VVAESCGIHNTEFAYYLLFEKTLFLLQVKLTTKVISMHVASGSIDIYVYIVLKH